MRIGYIEFLVCSMTDIWDVFISHASEDKDEVARPLAEALRKKGLRVWYDEYSLKLGDSLRRSIDAGLGKSTYGIVILSKNFFAKDWPQKELDGLDAKERDGKKVILPIWHDVTKEDVEKYSPMLAGRLAVRTQDGVGHIIDKIIEVTGAPTPVQPEVIFTDKIVRIEAEDQSFTIGWPIKLSGVCTNCGDRVRLFVSGPGQYAKGREIASPLISSSGNWAYEWAPGYSILPGFYTFSVSDLNNSISDEVLVKAIKGQLSIMARGSGTYYLGEKIEFSGVSLAGKNIYLSLKGPNAVQKERKLDDLTISCQNNELKSFVHANVRSDNTWSYLWDTSIIATTLDIGFYRIYAIEGPFTSDNLSGKAHSIIGIMIRKPFVSATVSQTKVANGDRIFITGTAEGVRNKELLLWIFGSEVIHLDKIYTNPDASYSYEIPPIISKKLFPGNYIALIQHPMMNNEFDIYFSDDKYYVRFNNPPKKGDIFFTTGGDLSLKGFEALGALVQALNEPSVDDTFVTVVFEVESPVIQFDPIDDISYGYKFEVTATTNLALDNQIFFEITAKQEPDKVIRSGMVAITKVDVNKISIALDSVSFNPGEYKIKAAAMDIDVNSSTNFRILEKEIPSK